MTANTNQHFSLNAIDDAGIARNMLKSLFKNYTGSFLIKLWDDSLLRIGQGAAAFTIALKQARVPRDLILYHDPIRLAEAYFDGEVEVEGDFTAALNLRYYLENLKLPILDKFKLAYKALSLHVNKSTPLLAGRLNSQFRQNSADSIAFHYDVSNSFYRLWLDERMVYSCAYFASPEFGLDEAQSSKLDLICKKLRLKSNETLLDIGCGWGALVCWAAKHYGVKAKGITLSRNQYEYALESVKKQGLEDRVTIEFRDYRTLPQQPTYDKVASIGMFEHVGLKNLTAYFSIVRKLLNPNGLFLNHGITSAEANWNRGVSTEFINRHVFPDGELDTISNIQQLMESTDFEIHDVENLRPHYAITLRHWVDRLERHHDEAVNIVGERTYRIWRLYMTASAIQFELGSTGIYQILASGREDGLPNLPLTRQDLYQ